MANGLLTRTVAKLLSRSAYIKPKQTAGLNIEASAVRKLRENLGGHIAPRPFTQTRWLIRDREDAIHQADAGWLFPAGLLWRSILTDGVFAGALSTRTSGIAALPRRFRGRQKMIEYLETGHDSIRSVYDELFPPEELATLLQDYIGLNVAIGEFREVEGRDYPVLRRLDPCYLQYRWAEGAWYYNSLAGPLLITPGDGHWFLMTGGGDAPWQRGLWQYASNAWIRKVHAIMYCMSFERTLANPARVASAPPGAVEQDRADWFEAVAAWGNETIFMGGAPGYEVKLLESQGTGWQSFQKTISACNEELLIAANGTTVTATGGSGFISEGLFRAVSQDLVKQGADVLAYFVNTQGLPAFAAHVFGDAAIDYAPIVEYDARPPQDINAAASSMTAIAGAMGALSRELDALGYELDTQEIVARYGVPARLKALPATVIDATWDEDDSLRLTGAVELADALGFVPSDESVLAELAKTGLEFLPKPEGEAPIEIGEPGASKAVTPVTEPAASETPNA